MPLDVVEPDRIGLARNRVGGGASQCVYGQGLELDLVVKVLQRDDPLRRSYIQRRWHSQASGRCNIGRTFSAPIALSRR